jgi:hypothetical protein
MFARNFQGLETGTGSFSKDWKVSAKFFQGLEKTAGNFPSLGKRDEHQATKLFTSMLAPAKPLGEAGFDVRCWMFDVHFKSVPRVCAAAIPRSAG